MKTLAFILFVLVTAAAASVATLLASRYWGLENQLSETRSQLVEAVKDRNLQEQEKIMMRLDRERVQTELETKLAEQRAQIDEATALHQKDMAEILSRLGTLEKQLNDAMAQLAPSAINEPQAKPAESPPVTPLKAQPEKPADNLAKPLEPPAKTTDVPKGAIPTQEQESRRLEKASP